MLGNPSALDGRLGPSPTGEGRTDEVAVSVGGWLLVDNLSRGTVGGALGAFVLLGAALCVAGAVSSARAQSASPNAVALIIGNAHYEHRDVPDVAYAHRDAEAFRGYVLEVLGYALENVLDLRDATRRELFDALGTRSEPHSLLWSYLDPEGGSDVVVFYSGHGVPGVNDGRGYLLPVDADPKAAEDDGYPIDLLYKNVGGLSEAHSVQVYLDACFSGGSHAGGLIANASPVFVQATLPEGLDEKVTSLAAASGKQVASWDEEARHGLFTHHLLDALYGAGDADADGRVTALEVKGYLDRHMTRAARRQHRRIQEASLMGAGHVVLASASQGQAFPARPALDGDEVTVVASGDEAVAATPEENPEEAEEENAEEMENALGLTRAQRMRVQRGLVALEFDVGLIDGAFGPRTRAAIVVYQKTKGWAETGYLSAEQFETLAVLGKEAQRKAGEEQRAERDRLAEEARRKAEEEVQRVAEEKRREDQRERRADDEAFSRAKSVGTLAAYAAYLRKYPQGRHVAETKRLRNEASRVRRVGEVFRDCPACPQMVVVPAGSYRMGSPPDEEGRDDSEGPMHRVTISKPIAVGRYEVTRGEYSRFLEETGYAEGGACLTIEEGEIKEDSGRGWRNPGYAQSDGHPVVCVSWEDAQAYARWLSRKTGKRYRLLSESEWEYAARAGTSTVAYWGDDPVDACTYENSLDAVTMFQVIQKLNEHFGSMQWIKEWGSERWQRWISNQDAGLQTVLGTVYLFLKPKDAALVTLDLYYQRNPARQPKRKLPSSKPPSMEEFLSSTKGRLCRDGHADTSSVGSFSANGFGLHDMLGNVSEWTLDCWNESYRGAPRDGSVWESAGFELDAAGLMRPSRESGECPWRVFRGGSWGFFGFSTSGMLRSASRGGFPADVRNIYLGFRVARTFAL